MSLLHVRGDTFEARFEELLQIRLHKFRPVLLLLLCGFTGLKRREIDRRRQGWRHDDGQQHGEHDADAHRDHAGAEHRRDRQHATGPLDHQVGGEDMNGPWEPAGKNWQPAVRTHVVNGISAAGAEVTPEELIAWCKEKLAGYKTPKRIVATEVNFRASNGKAYLFHVDDAPTQRALGFYQEFSA